MSYGLRTACTTMALVAALSATAFAGSVSVSSPTNGSTVGSPMHVVASASSSAPITAMRIYVDGASMYLGYANKIDTNVSVSSGTHSLVVQAWDSSGAVFKNALTVNVSSSSLPTTTGAKTFSGIDQMSGWEHCDVCSGANAAGPNIPYSMTQGVSSPSMDGKSAGFWVGGGAKYGSAIWWKQLGANSNVSHFTYDLYFYVKNMAATFALEFDTNQTTGGKRYVMGTQCGVNFDKQWDVWDTANKHWIKTGIPCTNVQAYQWNHLTEEYYRANGKIYYVSITLNGQKYYVNRSFYAIGINANDINVAFQMDMNGSATPYNAWLDQVKLTYW
jgi:hypothetical protein